ncbi:helicase-related protein [Seleniivibrio woodruffii]|uniref:SNF2 family DNA or RNA helicase n=1 Tax=Seleniivibrio woodruffii TaxID=1078050 RepID=A0A4R1K5V9_9BACT|nr:helicase-related protein [Seleniivibrio woodruffii]TCK58429.1 SNF2 family DNA or RNA helicase [Seleniivibrio woodruffii]TVZ36802.1 SNF2 family DNA or RNA helicase [Seleniivibrio woodruffii]
MDAVKILDNRNFGKVIDELKLHLEDNGQIKIISNKLSIFAFQELKRYLQKMSDTHILLYDTAQESFYSEMCGGIEDRYLRNKLATKRVAQEFYEWLENKCKIREQNSLINQNMFLVGSREALNSCIMGSSPFSTAGLGVSASSDHHMNTCFSDNDKVDSLQNWFDSLWDASNKSGEIKQNILHYLRLFFSEKSAKEIYFLTLYNIFKDLVSDLDEDKIIKTQTGIKSTRIWQKLYKFQRDGVLGAISKIERFNGCIIADSVGLGKTFEALAIIKYYELRNDRVLVLCPKKLRENWTLYTVNDKRNIFASDRFNYDVLNHTDLTRSHGYSGEINLNTLNWGNYDLVVIDESHNFRNSPTRKDYSVTRYSKLMNEIIKAGVKTKVLMLSATPVNNRMNDLKNQVAFIVEGNDEALKDNGIGSIEHTLKMAQTRFNAWLKLESQDRTTATLLERLNFDYFKLLDLLTIARSRKHIEKYYDTSEVGKFPERLKPLNIKTGIDIHEKFPSLDKINRDIRLLNLSAYAPLKYVLPQKVEEYSRKYDKEVAGGSVFRQVDREQSLIHLMRVNLFKRMESSIHSFSMTLEKLLEEVEDLLKKIQEHDANDSIEELDIEDIEVDDYEFAPFVVGKKVKVLIKDMDLIRWSQELEEDKEILKNLIQPAQGIKSPEDEKLRQIKQLIQNKVNNPINAGNKKVIIFTAFADTAKYLYENLSKWAFKELGIYSALVTGTGDNKTEMPGIRKDLASILTSFSPVSKERSKIDSNLTDEIDLLIATDCISEGQNLQDCDYLINYDIHWNPVRIIQRFGRVDRLGSKNDRIQLVNFWPNMELDEYINLEARVSGRMVLLDISATGEENVIEFSDSGKMNDLEYRRKQLERLQDEVVDIEDIEGGISITDLTLNDFRMDLGDYFKEHEDLLSKMPYGAYSVVELSADNNELLPGVIFCLKNEGSHAVSDSTYALSPYYLVYVSDEGSVVLQFTQVKKILDILKKTANSGKSISENAIDRLNKKTKNGNDMSHYQNLLGKAIQALTGAAEEKGVESLFSPGGTVMSKNSFKGIDDFEVVSFLILLGKKD